MKDAARPLNVLTIDLEDWFHVSNFETVIPRSAWDGCPTRLQETVPRLLDLLAEADTRATFFALGWVARRFPTLLRRIAAGGHELATHGDEHRLVTRQSPEEFREQLRCSTDAIEQASGQRVFGHRAPTYSFRKRTDWAIGILLECGLQYDSSIFPFGTRRDPELCDSCVPCLLADHGAGDLVEYPLSTFPVAGHHIPIAGGGYFRLLPYTFLRWAMRRLNARGQRLITYFHPWEIDPEQPRVHDASWLARFRHYHQLDGTEEKLRRLLSDFRFGSFREVFWSSRSGRYEILPQR
jgi:polysaccharide deacetylase family protein (PEP-CTERM system associated)